ncbi:MAG: sugar phosphate isomerase/epimerase [Bacteroidales bacterium]|jgi:sugar phosphate isomerase/epimerase|nr:sugar phosphate isomerase/epimerase [Bacteroidales bacterium]
MTNRRDFIKQSTVALAGGFLAGNVLAACTPTAVKKKVGLQLYSLRGDVNSLGIRQVLEIVAKIGYVNMETAGYDGSTGKIYGLEPSELKKICDDLGLNLLSAHLGRGISDKHDEDMAWWQKALDSHVAAGMKYMIMPSSPLRGDDATIDNVKRYGEYFNEIGQLVSGASLKFGYHNHDFEFKNKIDELSVYELLVENTNPQHVFFENDVFWTQRGGYNVVELLKKYPARIQVLHIKDERAVGESGTIDFKAIFDQFYANGWADYFVEMEDERTPQEDVGKSYEFLAQADYVK